MWRKPKSISNVLLEGRKKNWKNIDFHNDGTRVWTLNENPRFKVQKYTGPLPRVPYRIVMLPSQYGIAGGENINQLLNECWLYLVEVMPQLIPPQYKDSEIDQWIVQHITQLEVTSVVNALTNSSSSEVTNSPLVKRTTSSSTKELDEDSEDLSDDDDTEDGSSSLHTAQSSEVSSLDISNEVILSSIETPNSLNNNNGKVEELTILESMTVTTSNINNNSPVANSPSNNEASSRSKLLNKVRKKFNNKGKDELTTSGNGLITATTTTATVISTNSNIGLSTSFSNYLQQKDKHQLMSVWLAWFKSLFDEDAPKRKRTIKYCILISVFMTLYSLAVRYCSGDLFIVLVTIMNCGLVYIIQERKTIILFVAKRKMKRVANTKKKSILSWFGSANNGNGTMDGACDKEKDKKSI